MGPFVMKELTYCEYGPKLKRIRIKTQLKTFKTQKEPQNWTCEWNLTRESEGSAN